MTIGPIQAFVIGFPDNDLFEGRIVDELARLSEVGDNTGALAAIDESVRLRRHLAKSDPARYAAKLEQSLQLLSQIEAANHAANSAMMAVANSYR